MALTLSIGTLLIYLIIGTTLAYRWVLHLPPSASQATKTSARIAFFALSWFGVFILARVQTRISVAYFDPLDFPDDRGIPPDIAYDGTGNFVFALIFGWLFPFFCIMLAKNFTKKFKSDIT